VLAPVRSRNGFAGELKITVSSRLSRGRHLE